jgi:hypothetical protein
MQDTEFKAGCIVEVHNLKALIDQDSKYAILQQTDMIWYGFSSGRSCSS